VEHSRLSAQPQAEVVLQAAKIQAQVAQVGEVPQPQAPMAVTETHPISQQALAAQVAAKQQLQPTTLADCRGFLSAAKVRRIQAEQPLGLGLFHL
jgi:hypothetical protein